MPNRKGVFSKDQGKEKVNQNDQGQTQEDGAQNLLLDISQSTIEKMMNKENNYVKTLDNFQFSSFNPVPPSRKLAGDLFYLTAKTSDGVDCGITCCVNGFYKNDSVEKSVFNPSPSTRKNPVTGKSNVCFSYTLMGCLNQISPSFSKNLQQYMNQILNTEQYFLT